MSWGALPFWVWEMSYEHDLAKMQCCFEDEWFSGTSKVLPKHNIELSKATFKSWDKGGWNYERLQVQ